MNSLGSDSETENDPPIKRSVVFPDEEQETDEELEPNEEDLSDDPDWEELEEGGDCDLDADDEEGYVYTSRNEIQ